MNDRYGGGQPSPPYMEIDDYPGEAGLAYVAAAYEEKAATAEAEQEPWHPDVEGRHGYAEAAYGEAYWAYQKLAGTIRRTA